MYIDRIIYPIYTLGPGKRIAIWFSGCKKACKGCANPELWKREKKQKISINKVKECLNIIIKSNEVNGITLTGGDPLEQSKKDLFELIKYTKKINSNIDILLYKVILLILYQIY